jgi:hypothetical protein
MQYRHDRAMRLSEKRPDRLPLKMRVLMVVGWFVALAMIAAAFAL